MKRISILVLFLILVLSFWACESNTDSQADGDTESDVTSDGDKAEGDDTEAEKEAGEKADGDKDAGENAEGENADGDKEMGENAEGENADGDKEMGENVEGENADGDKEMGENADDDKDTVENADNTDAEVETEVDIAGKIWEDESTELFWQIKAPRLAQHYKNSVTYCDNLILAGFDDWRVPSITELRSLVRGCANSMIGGKCEVSDSCVGDSCWKYEFCFGCTGSGPGQSNWFQPVELSTADLSVFWSSTQHEKTTNSTWYIGFGKGEFGSYSNLTSSSVRCVRGTYNPKPVDGDTTEGEEAEVIESEDETTETDVTETTEVEAESEEAS